MEGIVPALGGYRRSPGCQPSETGTPCNAGLADPPTISVDVQPVSDAASADASSTFLIPKPSSPEGAQLYAVGQSMLHFMSRGLCQFSGTSEKGGRPRGGGFGGPIPERPFLTNAMRDNKAKYVASMKEAATVIAEALVLKKDPDPVKRALKN